jgi:hypothetical protein
MNEEWMNEDWDETTLTGDVVCYNLRAAIFAAYAYRVKRDWRDGSREEGTESRAEGPRRGVYPCI